MASISWKGHNEMHSFVWKFPVNERLKEGNSASQAMGGECVFVWCVQYVQYVWYVCGMCGMCVCNMRALYVCVVYICVRCVWCVFMWYVFVWCVCFYSICVCVYV